jgi:glycosyltransferase involved in cell wall biosynthesis
MDALDGDAETIFVDDGSRDSTYELMFKAAQKDPRFRLIRLSRNFGHQIALVAGVDFASGDAVIVMDADLQDPPEVVLDLAARWCEGYDVVYAVREERTGGHAVQARDRGLVLPRVQPDLRVQGATRCRQLPVCRPPRA